jgi:hypothetical protein
MGASESTHEDNDDEDLSDEEDGPVDGILQSSWEPSNYGLSPSDKRGLTKFYKAAGGDKWRTHASWLKQSPVGMWYGVSVASRNGEKMVTQLALHHNKLRGLCFDFIQNVRPITPRYSETIIHHILFIKHHYFIIKKKTSPVPPPRRLLEVSFGV